MDNKEDREWVLENVESINADVKDIDEICCALEHSTIFAIDHIQTFATGLIDLDYKYKDLQKELESRDKELERYKNIIKNIKEEIELYIDITIDHFETSSEEINFELRNKCRAMREIKSEILEIIEKELKGSDE